MIIKIDQNLVGQRLDLALSQSLKVSRSKAASLIKTKEVTAEKEIKPSTLYSESLVLKRNKPAFLKEKKTTAKLDIIFEDNDIIVINKPSGAVVHPGVGNKVNTISQALINYYPQSITATFDNSDLSKDRAGIVHRLDKDTSGVMVLAKNKLSLNNLQKQFQDQVVQKEYIFVCAGKLTSQTVDMPIARDSKNRMKKKVRLEGKNAITVFELQSFSKIDTHTLSYIKALPKTGRMHQIRVHASYLGNPILGDIIYGNKESKRISNDLNIKRVMLHAQKITFEHPTSGESISFSAPVATDLSTIINKITS